MEIMETFLSRSRKETSKLAKILAKEILRYKTKIKTALIFGLTGELGSGKTTFIQGFAKGLGIKKRLTSPSFVLMKKYKNVYHIDCYRIKNPKDIGSLDFPEIISNPKNIVLIEWAEKIKSILPKNTIWVRFRISGETKREIVMK